MWTGYSTKCNQHDARQEICLIHHLLCARDLLLTTSSYICHARHVLITLYA